MNLRITTENQPATTIKVDGRLTSDNLHELLEVIRESKGRITLDLSGLHFADDQGIRALQELRRTGAELSEARPYIAMCLEKP